MSRTESGTTIQRVGKSVTYGVTMIKDAPNPEAATAFLEFLLDPEGGLIVKD